MKLCEEAGCFVPAYRGGALKGIDIIARNLTRDPVSIFETKLPAGESISIQVKLSTNLINPPVGCDLLISAHRDAETILQEVVRGTTTKSWLAQSLGWLLTKTLTDFGIC